MPAKDELLALIEAAEIKLSDMAYQAKLDYQRMVREKHENTYAMSVRFDTLRMAATMMADVGAAVDKYFLVACKDGGAK